MFDPTPPAGGWPQPFEGITGQDRDDDLLSVEPGAMHRRRMMIMMGLCLRAATLGHPAPMVKRMAERMADPRPGDLVFEWSTARRAGSELPGLGVLIAHRREWSETDAEWAAQMAELPPDLRDDDDRGTDVAWYVQYGPTAEHVHRWVNAECLALPEAAPDAFAMPAGTLGEDGSVILDRGDLLDMLADRGINIQNPDPAEQ